MILNIFHMVVCYGKDGAVLVSYFFLAFACKILFCFLNTKFITNPRATEHVVVSMSSPLHLIICEP